MIARLPGASVSVLSRNDANWGTYGGIGPKYSTYMLQGLPLDAFVDPMSLDLNAIDHIEVQRGPASVFYPNYLSQDFAGNQSPLAGTINLILKQKIEQAKTLFKTAYGSYHTLNGQIFHQNRIGRLNYFCGSTYEMSDYTDYGVEGSWFKMNKDPEYKKTKVYGGVTLFTDKNEKQKFTIFFQETWHVGDSGRIYQGYDHQYATVNAGYDIAFSERLCLQSHLGLRSYDRSWQESDSGVNDALKASNGVNQVIVPVDLSFSWQAWKKTSVKCRRRLPGGDVLYLVRSFGRVSHLRQQVFGAAERHLRPGGMAPEFKTDTPGRPEGCLCPKPDRAGQRQRSGPQPRVVEQVSVEFGRPLCPEPQDRALCQCRKQFCPSGAQVDRRHHPDERSGSRRP